MIKYNRQKLRDKIKGLEDKSWKIKLQIQQSTSASQFTKLNIKRNEIEKEIRFTKLKLFAESLNKLAIGIDNNKDAIVLSKKILSKKRLTQSKIFRLFLHSR
jgi:hypothetical protein